MVALRQEESPRRVPKRRLEAVDAPKRLGPVDAPKPRLRAVDAPLPLVRRDTLPEHTDYRDTGCEISRTCQHCPLDRCKYEEPLTLRRAEMAARDREIAVLRRRHRIPVDMLAYTYGVTTRTIFRILSERR